MEQFEWSNGGVTALLIFRLAQCTKTTCKLGRSFSYLNHTVKFSLIITTKFVGILQDFGNQPTVTSNAQFFYGNLIL